MLVAFALLGDARIFVFLLNHVVFGTHKRATRPWKWGVWAAPPLLLFLTAIVRPWLFIAAAIGAYWVLDRFRVLRAGQLSPARVQSQPPEIIRLRKAHIPFAALRKLGAHNDVYDLEITRHEVTVEDLPAPFDGFRIAFLTDTHVASFMRRDYYREILEQVRRFDPDIILLGGDYVSWARHVPLLDEVLLSGLAARDGVYAILGNHDYWSGAEAIVKTLTARGVELITNRSIVLRRDGSMLRLLGIDEMYRGQPDVEAAFAGVLPGEACLGVSHHPDIVDMLGGRRLDLLLCGHTHGGQIRFPFFGAVVVPSRHEARYASGFHQVESVFMYVSRGIGAVPPLRILCRPELATFVLRKPS